MFIFGVVLKPIGWLVGWLAGWLVGCSALLSGVFWRLDLLGLGLDVGGSFSCNEGAVV